MTHYALQHVPFEDPGAITAWFKARGLPLKVIHVYERPEFPAAADVSGLVVMGGPMSVHDEKTLPWLGPEKDFLVSVIAAKRPVLGVCLGAQLLADVCGGEVTKNPDREIGWMPVRFSRDERHPSWARALPETLPVFHWHGETFSLPTGAIPLASTTACANQAFVYPSRNLVGLQFHLEATSAQMHTFLPHLEKEMALPLLGRAKERWVHTPSRIQEDTPRYEAAAHAVLAKVLVGIFSAP